MCVCGGGGVYPGHTGFVWNQDFGWKSRAGMNGGENRGATYDEHMAAAVCCARFYPDRLKTLNLGGRRRKKREE